MNKSPIAHQDHVPPRLANKLMALLLPKRLLDNVLGDLEEEFFELAERDIRLAKLWYWRQSLDTSMIYLSKKFGSVSFLGRLNFYLPLALFVIVLALISVLSNLQDPGFISDTFWDDVLAGKIHTAIFSQAFWQNFWGFIRISDIGMFIHPESMIIATVNIAVLLYLANKQQASALKLALWGYSLAFIPYIWSLIYIASNEFVPSQIGPIIATGIISLLYMLLPVSFLVHRKLKWQKKQQQQGEKERADKDGDDQEHQ